MNTFLVYLLKKKSHLAFSIYRIKLCKSATSGYLKLFFLHINHHHSETQVEFDRVFTKFPYRLISNPSFYQTVLATPTGWRGVSHS